MDGFKNLRAVYQWLQQEGYRISQATVYNDKAMLPEKDGVIPLKIAQNYIRAKGLRKTDGSPELQSAAMETLESKAASANVDVRLKEKRAQLLDIQMGKQQAALFPAEIAEREFGARAQAFKFGLEAWGDKMARSAAALFGGDDQTAQVLVQTAGGDPSRAPAVASLQMERAPAFVDLFRRELARALNDYASGAWLTDEMAEAMRAWIEERERMEQETVLELLEMVGAGPDQVQAVLARYQVGRKWK